MREKERFYARLQSVISNSGNKSNYPSYPPVNLIITGQDAPFIQAFSFPEESEKNAWIAKELSDAPYEQALISTNSWEFAVMWKISTQVNAIVYGSVDRRQAQKS